MITAIISPEIFDKISDFKIGILAYYDITVGPLPQMVRGRFDYFQEELTLSLEGQSLTDLTGIAEWRKVFKTIGSDPSRYRPSSEALYRRVKKGDALPAIHSAADINNYFSLKYEIPIGIYDLDQIAGPIEIRIGQAADHYQGLNGREMNMSEKLLSSDAQGPFGSPIVDSRRTMTTDQTKNALQVVYFKPSTAETEALQMLNNMGNFFEQIHGGHWESQLIHK